MSHPRSVPDRCALGGIVFVPRIGSPWRFLPKKRGGGSGEGVLAPPARQVASRRLQHLTMSSRRRRAFATLVMSLKFIVPSLMLRFPFVGAWGTYVLDSVDGDILLELGVSDETYQTIDKATDYFSYIIMLHVGRRWRIRRLMVLLFASRTIGQALFFKTRNEIVFLSFPNFLEPLVLAYTVLLVRNKGSEERAYASYRKHHGLIWIIITGYKVWNEWSLHAANIDLSERVFGFTGGARVPAQTPSPRRRE